MLALTLVIVIVLIVGPERVGPYQNLDDPIGIVMQKAARHRGAGG
jgi:hypothetical protein